MRGVGRRRVQHQVFLGTELFDGFEALHELVEEFDSRVADVRLLRAAGEPRSTILGRSSTLYEQEGHPELLREQSSSTSLGS